MAKTPRVQNQSRGTYLKLNQAVRAVEACACAWVEYGVSIRDLNLAEAVAARNVQAKQPQGLVYWVDGKDGKPVARPLFAEIPDVWFDAPADAQMSAFQEYALAAQANAFAATYRNGCPVLETV